MTGHAARRAAAAGALIAAIVLGGCAVRAAARDPQSSASRSRTLPAGDGREILEQDCTGCHGLDGLWAYQGYYNEARWRSMIVTMVDHGAELTDDEIAALTRYLVEHFGPGTRTPASGLAGGER